LTVEPSSIDLGPLETNVIQLGFDPAKEGESFAGNLSISVDAIGQNGPVGRFQVPVTIVAPEQ